MTNNICLACGNKATITSDLNSYRITCDLCGEFNIGEACKKPTLTEEEKIKLCYWLYTLDKKDKKRLDIILTDKNKDNFFSNIQSPSNLLEKIDEVLFYICSETKYFGEKINTNLNKYPLFFCKDQNEFLNILLYLNKEEFILIDKSIIDSVSNELKHEDKLNKFYSSPYKSSIDRSMEIEILPEGIKRVETLEKTSNINSKKCFVAMWFNDKEDKLKPNMEKIYSDYIKTAVENTDLKFEANKINDIHHVNDINDQIIAEIRRSRFLIADFTGDRGGVYFEAGFALGLGIPVIFTCHKDWFNGFIKPKCINCQNVTEQKQEKVHFDLAHRNFLLWTNNEKDEEYNKYNLDEFKKNLTARINTIII